MSDAVVPLGAPERADLARRRVTCPFLGPAVAGGDLAVRNAAADPLARIDELETLGDTGGGDLGGVLGFFAKGNHARMRGPEGHLDMPVPAGLFSLDLPGSQGSHPGHSGILQGDPAALASGHFDAAAFARLVAPARDSLITRADVGRFIADNLHRDPQAKVLKLKVAALLAGDLAALAARAAVEAIHPSPGRELYEKLTRLMGENNLMGSAGEYGLLFAFFGGRPDAREIDGQPTLPVADLTGMFRDLRLPAGWRAWRKRGHDWVANTLALAGAAGEAYLATR